MKNISTNKKSTARLTALLIALLMALSLTACGGNGSKEESAVPVKEGSQDIENEYAAEEPEQEEPEPEEQGPKEVDAIDMTVTYEWQDTYYDEEEGYNREYKGAVTESVKFVDYRVFPASDGSSCLIAVHFKKSLEETFRDAQGNEMEGSIDWLEIDQGIRTHEVTNVDTGEAEELGDVWTVYSDEIESGINAYEGLGEYLQEVGYEPYYGDEDDLGGIKPYKDRDFYYFYVADHAKGTVTYYVRNNADDEDYLTVTSNGDTEQIMRIDLE